jgi:sigma-70-like protein
VLDDFEARMEARDIIGKCLDILSEREQDIVIGRGVYRETFRSLGRNWGVSIDRIRQVEAKALRRTRSYLLRELHIRVPQREVYPPTPPPDVIDIPQPEWDWEYVWPRRDPDATGEYVTRSFDWRASPEFNTPIQLGRVYLLIEG